MTLPAGTSIGKYVVRRKIAEGGMAEIYLCSSRGAEGFAKQVVIKRIRSFLANDPEFIKMFITEARIASLLNHANVVQIFDFDKHEDTYYLAMEYVRGHSLWELGVRSKELMAPIPAVLVARIGADVARGLSYAHRLTEGGRPLGLVHRDVTPHNVLLSYEGAVKLTDFGIAKASTRVTAPGMLKGKFAYMAPEQARGEDVDPRTDVFALGIVLWELLTGAPLFEGGSDVAVLRAVQETPIRSPAALNSDVPGELEAVILRALQRDPKTRFQTALDFERALAQCVLVNAETLEDTDVGGFMIRLFGEPLPEAEEPKQFQLPEPVHERSRPVEKGVRDRTSAFPGLAKTGGNEANAAPRKTSPDSRTSPKGPLDDPARGERSGNRQSRPSRAGQERPSSGGDRAGEHSRKRPWAIGGLIGAVALVGVGLMVRAVQSGRSVSSTELAQHPPSGGKPPGAPLGTDPPGKGPVGAADPGHPSPDSGPATGALVPGVKEGPVALPDAGGGTAVAARDPVEPKNPKPNEPSTPGAGSPAEHPGNGSGRRYGTLIISVRPWAQVSVDGKKAIEVYGARTYRLSPGKHVVRLEHPSGSRTVDFVIENGRTISYEYTPVDLR